VLLLLLLLLSSNELVNAVQGNNRCLRLESYEKINTLYGQSEVLLIIKAGGTYTYHWTLKG
jgi:hypothetical protein